MEFDSLYFVWISPVLLLLCWHYKKDLNVLRSLAILLVFLTLLDPSLQLSSRELDVIALIDRSASCSRTLSKRLPEWEALLESTRPKNSKLVYVDFSESALRRDQADASYLDFNGNKTNLRTALNYALAQIEAKRSAKILVISDGFSTEPLDGVLESLVRRRITLDYRLLLEESEEDYSIESLNLPTRLGRDQPFIVSFSLKGSKDISVPYKILRDGRSILSGDAELHEGKAVLRFNSKLEQEGAYKYEVQIFPANDVHSGNNKAEAWIEATGQSRILLLSEFEDDPLLSIFKNERITQISDVASLNSGALASANLIIINNVIASQLSQEFLRALKFFVEVQGGGLLMLGGKNSFGSGGYYGTPVEEVMPVTTELREEHRKLPLAMAIILDRSGSMAAPVAGNLGNLTKIALADEGAANTASLLYEKDFLTVLAVDSEAHIVVPLRQIGNDHDKIARKVRSITSAGGGIFVYQGLNAAWNQLKDTKVERRHIILFSDAADSEEPGDYKKLLAEIVAARGSVSVIGMGSPQDSDAQLLQEIASLGQGRIFFVQNAMDIPAIFAQETAAVARSTFVEEPTATLSSQVWQEVTSGKINWLEAVDGYNLNYLKEKASQALISKDDYNAPLVAYWHKGAGKTAAVAFPVAGNFSSRARSWNELSGFLKTLGKWAQAERAQRGISLKTKIVGSNLNLELYHDDTWLEKISQDTPRIFVNTAKGTDVLEISWNKIEPRRFSALIPLDEGQVLKGAVQLGKYTLPFGPVSLVRNSEWIFETSKVNELRDLAERSGGTELTDLGKVWERGEVGQKVYIKIWLLIAALCIFLLDALLTRLNYEFVWPKVSLNLLPKMSKFLISLPKLNLPTRSKTASTNVADEITQNQDSPKPSEKVSMRERFARAKNKEGR